MRPFIYSMAFVVMLQACNGRAAEKTRPADAGAIAVKLLPISSDSTRSTIEASGLLGTENEARLSFKIAGIIENVFVKEGQSVKKGQLLATLRSAEIAAQVQQVKLTIDKAQRDYERTWRLYQDSVSTLEQVQNAKTAVDLARQSLQQAAFNEQYSRIYAPADGFIVKRSGNPGELASAGNPVIIMNAVSGGSKWILKVGVPDKEWAVIENGNKALVHLDAYPGIPFTAVVSKKLLAADPVSGSFQVELQVKFDKQIPAAGLFGKAIIYTDQPISGFSIPYEALLEANGRQGFVFVSDDGKTVKKIPVTLSDIRENVVYIADGLQGHSFVVTSGSPYLADNSAITISQ